MKRFAGMDIKLSEKANEMTCRDERKERDVLATEVQIYSVV